MLFQTALNHILRNNDCRFSKKTYFRFLKYISHFYSNKFSTTTEIYLSVAKMRFGLRIVSFDMQIKHKNIFIYEEQFSEMHKQKLQLSKYYKCLFKITYNLQIRKNKLHTLEFESQFIQNIIPIKAEILKLFLFLFILSFLS